MKKKIPQEKPKKQEAVKKSEVKAVRVRKPKPVKQVEAPKFGLHNLTSPAGSHKKRKLLGRGPSSGHGKTSTRGSKGQTSRAGRHFYLGFEGGTSPLIRRMPKRGFRSHNKKIFQIVNLQDLARIKESTINPELLKEKGLIKDKNKLIKILGEGTIKNALTVSAHAFSKRASQEITAAGGKVELINV